jgi:hypothetical protein
MTSLIRKSLVALLCAAATAAAQQAPTLEQNQEANIKAYVDLLRKDMKKEKVAIITEVMELTPEESSKFWPVYNDYDKELTALADERIAFLRMYGENLDSLTDQKVTQIITGLLDVQARRNALHKKYFDRMSKTLGAKLAGRFLQVEHQLLLILDLQISSSLPVVE